jgi:hypothetical protein
LTQSTADQDPALTFDVSLGQAHLGSGADRTAVAIVPLAALTAAASALGREGATTLGHGIGRALGARAKLDANLGVEAAVDVLGAAFSLAGLGTLSLERWGQALVIAVGGARGEGLADAAGSWLVAGVLEAMLSAATGRASIAAVVIERAEATTRFAIVGAARAESLRGWLDAGLSGGEALVRLHAPKTQEASA